MSVQFFLTVAKAGENPQTKEFCEKLGIDNPFTPTGKSAMTQTSGCVSVCSDHYPVLL